MILWRKIKRLLKIKRPLEGENEINWHPILAARRRILADQKRAIERVNQVFSKKTLHELARDKHCPTNTFLEHDKRSKAGACYECNQEEENKRIDAANRPMNSQGDSHPFNRSVL